MVEQEWEDEWATARLEAEKAEAKRKKELGDNSVSQADEDRDKTDDWEALKRKSEETNP